MSTPSVTVLMSTYNGQKYICEQLDSLLNQKGVDVRILVRDDGSKDATVSIITEYSTKHPNIKLLKDTNCGAEESFNRLCRYALAETDTDYYAFCDQDDVWDGDKLQVATSKLNTFEVNKPNLYFSNLRMVDENLNYIRDFYSPDDVFTDRCKTLVQIFTYGCTCVFNRKALQYYCQPVLQQTFHDNWVYCICSYLGNVGYDPTGHIQYRQHSSNLSGHRDTGLGLLASRIKRPFKGKLGNDFEIMARQLLKFADDLQPADLKTIKRVATYRSNMMSKLRLLFSSSFATGHLVKDLCIKYRILFNCL